MKLATLKNNTRDGALVVVSRDLTRCANASNIAPTMQAALDQWCDVHEALSTLAAMLENHSVTAEPFDQSMAHSPLPRAYQWADGSAYVNHVELVRKARGAAMPDSFWTDPLMYQGGSDTFLAPHDPIRVSDTTWGIDMEGEVAVIVDDVPMGISPTEALQFIRLIMLVNDVSLRALIPAEIGKGFGFFHAKPSSAFSPVALTPDELGDDWRDGKLHLPLRVHYNGELFGRANAGVDMTFNFGQLIAHAARTRRLSAGTIIGSGTVSNKLGDEPGKAIANGGDGYSCIAELRMIETINTGQPETSFMSAGDTVRINMLDARGDDLFGTIDQLVQCV